jgi:hypothetical protein
MSPTASSLTTTRSRTRSQVPSAVHFCSRSWAVFHGPYRSGRSRHGAPVLACYKIALIVAARGHLLEVMESLPRSRSHLDVWVSNEIRRPSGEVVLLDWAFVGDGAVGEDVGNHVPDAVFDLFWPAEAIGDLDAACFEAHLAGLREGGWRGQADLVRLGMVASCVKYVWLLPLLLERASQAEHQAYHQAADAERLYQQRGLALARLVTWCDEALELAARGDVLRGR